MNTSATGGYLRPASTPAPLQGLALEDFLHDVIAGVTGLNPQLVRPSYQGEPPNMPDLATVWCAFAIERRRNDAYGALEHDPGTGVNDAQANDVLRRHQTLELLCSFYDRGEQTSADAAADELADGLLLPQNRGALLVAGMAVQETGDPLVVPALVKERWRYRVDLPLVLRREVRREYPILNFASASVFLRAEEPGGHLVVDDTVIVPPP